MAIVGETKTVTASPTFIVAGFDAIGNARPMLVRNTDATNTVFLGGPAVDTTGFPLKAGEMTGGLPLMTGDDLYGITAGSSVAVSVLRGRS